MNYQPANPPYSSTIGGASATTLVSSPPDTVENFVSLILQQTQELCQRSANVARRIAGDIPAAVSASEKEPQPCIISQLRLVSQGLAYALSETERAERSL